MKFVYSSNSVTLPTPQYGYSVAVNMAVNIIRGLNGEVKSWDNGATNDFRMLSAKWLLTESEKSLTHTFFDNVNGGRCNEFAVELGSSITGFFPFGPDHGDKNDFLVYELENSRSGRQLRPYDRYWFEVSFLRTLSPSYTLPSLSSEGSFTIGTITGLPFPLSKPEYFKTGSIDVTNGGLPDILDNGIYASYTDAEISIETNQANMANLVNYLVTTARGTSFSITTPENSNIFGAQNGDGTFTVCLTSNKIVVEHTGFNLFKIALKLYMVAKTA